MSKHWCSQRQKFALGALLSAGAVLGTKPSAALDVRLTAGELARIMERYRDSGDPLQAALAQDVRARLAAKGLSLTRNGLLGSGSFSPKHFEALSCHDIPGVGPRFADLRSGQWSVFLPDNVTRLDLHAGGGHLGFDASVGGTATARAEVTLDYHRNNGALIGGAVGGFLGGLVGSQIGGCSHLRNENVTLSAEANDFSLASTLDLDLKAERRDGKFFIVLGTNPSPTWAPLTARPDVKLALRAHDSPLRAVYNQVLSGYAQDLQADIENQVQNAVKAANENLRKEVREQGAVLKYELDATGSKVLETLIEAVGTPALSEFVANNANEVAFLLLANDAATLKNMLLSSAACQVLPRGFAGMSLPQLFTRVGGECRAADLFGSDAGSYFSDPACSRPIAFRPRSNAEYCSEMIATGGNDTLGNAARWTAEANQPNDPAPAVPSRRWTLSPGTMLDVSSERLAGKHVPFMKQLRFRSVTSRPGAKACELEMRVYKRDVNATGLRPMLALHGGAWRFRSFAFAGLEAEIAQYTDAGFLVFTPFYRLSSSGDGGADCQNASADQIVSDVDAALSWITSYADAFGGDGSKPVLLGQSAGAHLATSLLVRHPNEIGRGLLFYAPSDAQSYLEELSADGFPEEADQGLSFLEDFLDVGDLTAVNLANPPALLTRNSFHAQVVPAKTPPVFLIHGGSDHLVPASQSIGLCNAYGSVQSLATDALSAKFSCGTRGSQLRLIEQGDHALDVCIDTPVFKLCPGGDAASRQAIVAAMREARAWLATPDGLRPVPVAPTPPRPRPPIDPVPICRLGVRCQQLL